MTPTELADAARRAYNASNNDPFFSNQQMFEWIYDAEMQLCKQAWVAERVFTATTVAGTQEYQMPTNMFAMKRVQYDGQNLERVTFREDDSYTGGLQTSTEQGTPFAFVLFAEVMYLRPIPDSAKTLKIWGYVHPAAVPTASSTLTTPDDWHIRIKEYLLSQMSAKNKNYDGARWYQDRWDLILQQAVIDARRKQRGSRNAVVQNVDVLPYAIYGTV